MRTAGDQDDDRSGPVPGAEGLQVIRRLGEELHSDLTAELARLARFEPAARDWQPADFSDAAAALIAGASDRLLVLKVRPTFGRTVIASVEVEVSWVAYQRLVEEGAGLLRRGRPVGGP